MGKITLTESDQALLCMLSAKQAGAVLHRLLGKDSKLDAAGEGAYRAITEGEESRKAARERKRKSRALHCDSHVTVTGMSQEKQCDSHVTVTDLSQDNHKTAPPFLPPSSSPPTPPVSPPPYNPPTAPPAAGALCEDFGSVMSLFFDRIDRNASPMCLDKLGAYIRELGPQVVGLAICNAIDAGAEKWAYIENILRRCQKCGIRSAADWERHEEERARQKEGDRNVKKANTGKQPLSPTQPNQERLQQDFDRLDKLLAGLGELL